MPKKDRQGRDDAEILNDVEPALCAVCRASYVECGAFLCASCAYDPFDEQDERDGESLDPSRGHAA